MIICCGEALIDMVPYTTSDDIDTYRPLPGGSPYNTAIAIGRLGAPVSFMGRLSSDFFGTMLVDRLRANNVETNLIVRSTQNSTLAFVKIEAGKEPQYAFYTEGTADRSFSVEDLPKTLPQDLHGILFGSISMTMEPVASTIETFIQSQSRRNDASAPVISLDPNVRPVMIHDRARYVQRLESWIASATIVKISGADLEYVYPSLSREAALEKVLSLGPTLVVTTLGADGALAIGRRSDGSRFSATAPVVPVKVADTIGAGDTFHGALLSWLELKGKLNRLALSKISEADLHEALFFANKAASLVCTKHGAEPPTMAEMEALQT
ncbi:carbohydrate kinase family protein [Gracilinema caldarium]|uniref:Fructokinase n=1 Tax=Gracilinema caldarium (strain ATCC 51460 / DSM 7334 / H1) TaxID=744872 RepID=F8F345_GRAC1|nr:carbohydrate kinase [Gracilinema caldarium]AEJ20371.1 Fructokinase [Gracilinema caldarium DSM 7334]